MGPHFPPRLRNFRASTIAWMRLPSARVSILGALASGSRFVAMKAGTQKDLPYGSWPSPITAKFITTASVRLGSLSVDREGELHWLEGRPQEKGRQVVVRYCGESATSTKASRAAASVP